ncbi:hypothetical protein TgHK011_003718 [Trichoderma gracile]|nr:hypothetical protein TgHK011_003718 [Trichoderma gracile]
MDFAGWGLGLLTRSLCLQSNPEIVDCITWVLLLTDGLGLGLSLFLLFIQRFIRLDTAWDLDMISHWVQATASMSALVLGESGPIRQVDA